jgi:uncharacterized protein
MKNINRRTFLRAGAAGVAAMAAGVAVDSFIIEPHRFELVRRIMPIENRPASLVGRTLLHISDIHVGPRVSSEYLIRAFTFAQSVAPDFVAFTGDFISYRSAGEYLELARVLRSFPRGRLGTVASLGNHDYGPGWRRMDVADQVTRVAADLGIQVLRNRVLMVGGVQFAGLADFWSPEFGPAQGVQSPGLFTPDSSRHAGSRFTGDARLAIASIDRAQPTVILSHNPDAQDEPLWDGVRGWVLAGHTHGGQVKPPFLPPPILPVRNKLYTAGTFDVGPGRTLYINRGLGHLLKVRFNCRPELTLFTLAAA